MLSVSTKSRPADLLAWASDGSDIGVPQWASELLIRNGDPCARSGHDNTRVISSSAFTLVSVRVPNAASLERADFELATRQAYNQIAERLSDCPARHPVRFWNYIPDIHRPCGDGMDRYMCFNAGRFAACSDWLGGPDTFERLLATGSGVGHEGSDLVIHALAALMPGTAVENPRQVPAYRYSRRFGPRPPCFARATIVREPSRTPLLLVGGTASIRGEESVHIGDLSGQTRETFENLASLVQSAGNHAGLRAFRDLRVYHSHESDQGAIARTVEDAFPALEHLEFVLADLCRPELAVEIEGVAELASQA
jgi:enamine deaminase RidA (YjgF/YER057c/UK114 family)